MDDGHMALLLQGITRSRPNHEERDVQSAFLEHYTPRPVGCETYCSLQPADASETPTSPGRRQQPKGDAAVHDPIAEVETGSGD